MGWSWKGPSQALFGLPSHQYLPILPSRWAEELYCTSQQWDSSQQPGLAEFTQMTGVLWTSQKDITPTAVTPMSSSHSPGCRGSWRGSHSSSPVLQATGACKSREPEAQLAGTVPVPAALCVWMDFQVLGSPKCTTETRGHMRNYRGVLGRGCRGGLVQLQ